MASRFLLCANTILGKGDVYVPSDRPYAQSYPRGVRVCVRGCNGKCYAWCSALLSTRCLDVRRRGHSQLAMEAGFFDDIESLYNDLILATWSGG